MACICLTVVDFCFNEQLSSVHMSGLCVMQHSAKCDICRGCANQHVSATSTKHWRVLSIDHKIHCIWVSTFDTSNSWAEHVAATCFAGMYLARQLSDTAWFGNFSVGSAYCNILTIVNKRNSNSIQIYCSWCLCREYMVASLALLQISKLSVDNQRRKQTAELALYLTTTALCQKHRADMRLLAANLHFAVENYVTCVGLCQDPHGLNEQRSLFNQRVSLAYLRHVTVWCLSQRRANTTGLMSFLYLLKKLCSVCLLPWSAEKLRLLCFAQSWLLCFCRQRWTRHCA